MTRDYIERYLHSDPENLFVEFISEEKNYGLFAKESFVKGDFIVFYRGVRLTETQYLNKLRESEVANEYIFTDVKNGLFIDATDVALDSTGVASYANDEHKKPNMKAKTYIAIDESRHVQLVVIKNISEKEELVYDYGATHLPWRKTIKHQSKKIRSSSVAVNLKDCGREHGSATVSLPDNVAIQLANLVLNEKAGSEDGSDDLSETEEASETKVKKKSRRTSKRSKRRLGSKGTEECVICLKSVKKV